MGERTDSGRGRWAAWAPVVGTAAAVFLGAVLLFAVWAKALDPGAFAEEIRAQGLDFLLPAGALVFVALGIEAALGAALLLGIRRLWVLVPAAGLVAFFLFLTGRDYWRFAQGLEVQTTGCGCFGNLVQRTPAEAFWQDLFLLVPALGLAFVGRHDAGGDWPKGRLAAVAAITLAALLFSWASPALPLDDLATRLHPGAELSAICAGADGERVCLDALVPALAQGRHLVVLADLEDERFGSSVEKLNRYVWDDREPPLRVLTTADADARHEFFWEHGPAFDLQEVLRPVMRPLYRTLPRSFIVEEGVVVETFEGLPPALDDRQPG